MIDATQTHRLRFALSVILILLLLPTMAGAKPKALPKAILWKSVVRCNVAKVEKVLTTNVFDPQDLGKALWMSVTRFSSDNQKETINIVRLLLDKGAYVDYADVYERTPLMVASESRNSELVKLLLINGADPKRADSKGRRASDYAAAAARSANNVMKLLDQ